MSTIIPVYFSDFKRIIGNNRVYYYIGDAFYDFHFVFDGMIVKSTVLKQDIKNEKQFFSDKMFYNSIELTFNINLPRQNLVETIEGIKLPLTAPITELNKNQPLEVKNVNIQREGVGMDIG